MPYYRWHLLAGLFSFFILFFLFRTAGLVLPIAVWVFSLLVCLFSSLVPDIDTKKSKINRIIMDSVVAIVAVLIIVSTENFSAMLWLLLFWFLLSVLGLPLKHRGFVHTIWTAALYGFVIGFIAQTALQSFIPGFFAFLGYFSHLALDKKV